MPIHSFRRYNGTIPRKDCRSVYSIAFTYGNREERLLDVPGKGQEERMRK